MKNSLVRNDAGGPAGLSAPGYMRVSLKPFQPLLAAMSLASIAHSAPRNTNRKKMPASALSNRTKLSGGLWAISRPTATPTITPKQAVVSHRVHFMGQIHGLLVG